MLIILFAAFAVNAVNSLACGPYFEWYEGDALSFVPYSALDSSKYSEFYLKHSLSYGFDDEEGGVRYFYSDSSSEYETLEMKRQTNIDLWRGYFKRSLKKILADHFIEDIIFYFKDEAFEQIKGDKEALEYLKYLNAVNDLVIHNQQWAYGSWEASYSEDIINEMKTLVMHAQKKLNNTKDLDAFLKSRYAYNIIRLAAVTGQYQLAVDSYNNTFDNGDYNEETYIKMSALGYKARALYMQKNIHEALDDYITIFNQSPLMRRSVLLSFKYMGITDAEYEQYIESSSDENKIMTIFLRTLLEKRSYSAKPIRRILEIDPSSFEAEYLLVRALNNIEKYNMRYEQLHFYIDVNSSRAVKYTRLNDDEQHRIDKLREKGKYDELSDLCNRTWRLNDVRTPKLWNAAGLYLALLDGDLPAADEIAELRDSFSESNPGLELFYNILLSLKSLSESKSEFSEEAKEMLSKNIKAASKLNNPEKNNRGIYHSLWVLAARKHLANGELAEAAIALSEAGGEYGSDDRIRLFNEYYSLASEAHYLLDVLMTDEELGELESILRKEKGYKLHSHVEPGTWLSASFTAYLRGVRAIRREAFAEAAEHFKRIPRSYKLVRFTLQPEEISAGMPVYKELPMFEFASLLSSLQSAVSKEMASDNPDYAYAARKLFLLGNIFYSIKGHREFPNITRKKRRNWDALSIYNPYSFSEKDFALIPKEADYSKKRYERFKLAADNFLKAEEYYKRVVALDADKELSAKSCILANMSKNVYLSSYTAFSAEDYFPEENIELFEKFAGKYKETDFYERYIVECPLLEEFE